MTRILISLTDNFQSHEMPVYLKPSRGTGGISMELSQLIGVAMMLLVLFAFPMNPKRNK